MPHDPRCGRVIEVLPSQEGEGLMMVLAVGVNTYQGKMVQKINEDEDEKSVLQRKLDDMTALITKVAYPSRYFVLRPLICPVRPAAWSPA